MPAPGWDELGVLDNAKVDTSRGYLEADGVQTINVAGRSESTRRERSVTRRGHRTFERLHPWEFFDANLPNRTRGGRSMMHLDEFYALRTGRVFLPDREPATLEAHELGLLRVPSGRLGVCDPIWLDTPDVLPVPAGDHKVVVTMARVAENYDLSM